jgi:hypothetical protein
MGENCQGRSETFLAYIEATYLSTEIIRIVGNESIRSEEVVITYPFEPLIFNPPFSCRGISPSAVSAIAQPLVRSIN